MKANITEYDSPVMSCVGKNVAVVGGGNTAMDAVRTSLRLGTNNSYLIYRRSEAEMPARLEEIHHAKEEGVEFMTLNNPVELYGDENGRLKRMKCIKMELGEPDDSGRRRPVPVKGSEYILDVDIVIMAIGNGSSPLIQNTTEGIDFNKWGNIIVNPETMRTSKPGVYAGGDIISGGATVILAMGNGREAAKAIHEFLS